MRQAFTDDIVAGSSARTALLCGGNVLVVDDFLSPEGSASLWSLICRSPFRGMHRDGLEKVYRLYDGECMAGPNATFSRGPAGERGAQPGKTFVQPGGSSAAPRGEGSSEALQVLFAAMLASRTVGEFLQEVGRWDTATMRPYVYPVGTGLGWHTDRAKAAAFIYYAHPEWRAHWGGELLVAPAVRERVAAGSSFQDFYGDFDDGQTSGKDLGAFVAPVPNRLAMIRGGVPHCIKRVEPAAGDAFRASVAGFFMQEGGR